MYDAELYRSKAEVREWMTKHDPIQNHQSWLAQRGWLSAEERADVEHRVTEEVARAVEEAEAGPFEPIERLTADVYAERTP